MILAIIGNDIVEKRCSDKNFLGIAGKENEASS
jgi:hypothetical protein